jgi:NAD(P)-dependent dehydrogenase (short-subunit alcohol dehydrogenase family)
MVFRAGLFEGEVALVTGGGTGIGLATALELAGLGARLVIAGRRAEKLESAAAQIRATGAECLAQPCDIRELDQIAALLDATLARFGRIDLLVNNAGGQFPTSAESLKPKGWDAVIRNNLSGTWYLTQAVGTRAMIPARRGRIVNVIANIARGFPGMVHTGAARAGVENMTRTLAVEWAQYGVRVVAIAPGVIRSTGTDQYPPEIVEAGRQRTPLKRFGTVEEVAHSIVFLGSRAAADFITGVTLYVDGGASLWGDSWPIPDHAAG